MMFAPQQRIAVHHDGSMVDAVYMCPAVDGNGDPTDWHWVALEGVDPSSDGCGIWTKATPDLFLRPQETTP